jgi:hypothetical protein
MGVATEGEAKAYPVTVLRFREMTNGLYQGGSIRKEFNPDFVIGIKIDEQALAFYYEEVEAAGFIQAAIGDWPVLV